MTRQEYHHEAAACARMAEQTTDPTTRMVSVGLAQAWLRLAELAEKDRRRDAADKPAAPTRETEDDLRVLAEQS